MITEEQEKQIAVELSRDNNLRDRGGYLYTNDVLPGYGLITWPTPNASAKAVIEGRVDYDSLPYDPDNQIYKGMAFADQQALVKAQTGPKLCEALNLQPCREVGCNLYIRQGYQDPTGFVYRTPVCREFKMAFTR